MVPVGEAGSITGTGKEHSAANPHRRRDLTTRGDAGATPRQPTNTTSTQTIPRPACAKHAHVFCSSAGGPTRSRWKGPCSSAEQLRFTVCGKTASVGHWPCMPVVCPSRHVTHAAQDISAMAMRGTVSASPQHRLGTSVPWRLIATHTRRTLEVVPSQSSAVRQHESATSRQVNMPYM